MDDKTALVKINKRYRQSVPKRRSHKSQTNLNQINSNYKLKKWKADYGFLANSLKDSCHQAELCRFEPVYRVCFRTQRRGEHCPHTVIFTVISVAIELVLGLRSGAF